MLIGRDTREVMEILRAAVTTSGLSQAAFARSLGTSAPRLSTYLNGRTRPSAEFCMRARRLGQALDAASERGLMSAPATAAVMREHLLAGDVEWIWRMLLQGRDHLALMLVARDQVLVDSWEAQPGNVGSAGWDALLAGVAGREFEQAGIEAPSWSRVRPLPLPWMPEHPFLSPERVTAQTPTWLRSLNVFVPQRDLVTA